MSKYSLFIADADTSLTEKLSAYMNHKTELEVIGSTGNGIQALCMIQTTHPDIVLIDPLLPEMDGISLIKQLQIMKNVPVIVCMSHFYTPACIEMARNSGANYYVYKPIALNALASILVECARMVIEDRKSESLENITEKDTDLHRRIHIILRELGFSSKHAGSKYIAASVALAWQAPLTVHNLSSGLYRKLAEQTRVSSASIERSMRTAISHANANGRLSEKIGHAPTNKSCIRYILQELNSTK